MTLFNVTPYLCAYPCSRLCHPHNHNIYACTYAYKHTFKHNIALNFRGSYFSTVRKNISTKIFDTQHTDFSRSDCMQECQWTISWDYRLPNQQRTLSKEIPLKQACFADSCELERTCLTVLLDKPGLYAMPIVYYVCGRRMWRNCKSILTKFRGLIFLTVGDSRYS